MRKYVKDGTVQVLRAVEPVEPRLPGRLRGGGARLGHATLKAGASFKARHAGQDYKILPGSGSAAPSVVLGPPTVFDKSNIDKFKF